MERLGEFWRRLAALFGRQQLNRDLEEEMRFHLDMKAEESDSGAARRQFGNVALLQEDSRKAWGWTRLDAWVDDIKYGVRVLRKNPGYAAVSILTMMLGIGATTAVFSVVHGVVLRPLPFRDPERLMMVWETREKRGDERAVVSYQNFMDWKEQSRSFEHLAAFVGDGARSFVNEEPVFIEGARVTAEFFSTMGVQPMLGRTFSTEQQREGGYKAALLSYGFWQRLGGDSNLIGKAIRLDRQVMTVAGIMPPGFSFPKESELWFPLTGDDPRNRGAHWLRVIGRLRPGVTVERAQSEMKTIGARLQRIHPDENKGIGASVVPLHDQIIGEARRPLLILMGAVGCLLLIACANAANLLLVRITSRHRELALRLALGAGRWRVARCVLVEGVLLSLAGGALGAAAAYSLVRAFVALDPIHLPRVQEVAVNGRVLMYAVLASAGTGILFGLLPALRAARVDPADWLKEGVAGFRTNSGRSVLAAAQIALAVTLLIGAGLLLRSFVLRVNVPLGFRPEGVVGVELPWSVNGRIDELLDRLRALPGVRSAGAATAFPQDPAGSNCDACLEIEGMPQGGGPGRDTGLMIATADFFAAAGMGLRQGRFLTASDGAQAPKVAVINEALARRDFANQNPLGRHVRWGEKEWSTIVGVVGNAKGFGVAGAPMPAVYFPNRQARWGNGVQVLVRTAVPPLSMAGVVRKEIRSWNPRILIERLDSMDNLLSETVAVPRFYMMLVAGFSVLALLISAVGVYGTVNYSVTRRTHEIGIRMALGAMRGDVLAIVLGQGLRLTAVGLVLGLAGAWVSTRVMENLLFGVRPTDPVAFVSSAGVLMVAVLLACYIPARRAAKVDPLTALRHE